MQDYITFFIPCQTKSGVGDYGLSPDIQLAVCLGVRIFVNLAT